MTNKLQIRISQREVAHSQPNFVVCKAKAVVDNVYLLAQNIASRHHIL